jgi:hypothetical protein
MTFPTIVLFIYQWQHYKLWWQLSVVTHFRAPEKEIYAVTTSLSHTIEAACVKQPRA